MELVTSALWVVFIASMLAVIILSVLLWQEMQSSKRWEAEAYRLGERINEIKYSRRLR